MQDSIGVFLYFFYCLWCRTLRYKEKNKQVKEQTIQKYGSAVVCLWHDELFPLPYIRKKEKAIAVVSQSKDGDLLTGVLKRLGLTVYRGSSSRGGFQVLRSTIKEMDKGSLIFFTVDGPRGPRHCVKKGALFLAGKCGIPIIPVRIFMSQAVRFKSWDRFQLPKPFSKVQIVWGDAYKILDIDVSGDMTSVVKELEEKLNNLR